MHIECLYVYVPSKNETKYERIQGVQINLISNTEHTHEHTQKNTTQLVLV